MASSSTTLITKIDSTFVDYKFLLEKYPSPHVIAGYDNDSQCWCFQQRFYTTFQNQLRMLMVDEQGRHLVAKEGEETLLEFNESMVIDCKSYSDENFAKINRPKAGVKHSLAVYYVPSREIERPAENGSTTRAIYPESILIVYPTRRVQNLVEWYVNNARSPKPGRNLYAYNVKEEYWMRKYQYIELEHARLDSKGNYFATILLSGDDSLIVRVDLSNRIGQVSHFERTNIYTSVLAETQNFYIIGTSPPSILGLDATTLQLKWTANVTGSEMILVNSANSKDDVIYAADYNILHKIRVNDGRIISSFKFPHDIDNIAYVSGVNGWVSVTLANDTSISVSFLNIENQIETRLEVMSTRHMPHVDSNSACSYPIATANQTGNILEITSIVKCEITSGFGGSEKIIAVKSRFDKNSLKPLPNEPNLIWSTDTSALVIAQIDSKTILSMEYSAENSIYIQYDISTGKIIKTSPSRISSGYGFPYLVTSSNNKVYRYELTPHIDVESADL
ncbi:predicted protein [Naegleria gruberi]|uniref:Predicted protein n=1 Tax=Naegleria gruberi TaxID=5762 RepID=D2W452_NAEGR|nr:uncharacterized protein NAEGRDRAFT_76182 [Naegleria gruberi]EFC36151.1 predicted protein [Naegleria gruberi]|eukprot:XP_002668895.1 predicted protein [Naegleria gruberi strain NEG-M]